MHKLFVCMRIFYSDSIPLCGDCTGSCTYERRVCSEYAHECGYSLFASLCNNSFLVRLHASSKSPALYVVEVYADQPIRYDRTGYPACMHTVSVICPWATVLVYNMVSMMYFEP